MVLARKEGFKRQEVDFSDLSKAFAHPARVAILTALAKHKECICGELVVELPLAQSTVSQHLKTLKEIGLIRGTIEGPRSKYCVDWKIFDRYQRRSEEWFTKLSKYRKDNCC